MGTRHRRSVPARRHGFLGATRRATRRAGIFEPASISAQVCVRCQDPISSVVVCTGDVVVVASAVVVPASESELESPPQLTAVRMLSRAVHTATRTLIGTTPLAAETPRHHARHEVPSASSAKSMPVRGAEERTPASDRLGSIVAPVNVTTHRGMPTALATSTGRKVPTRAGRRPRCQ